MIESVIVPRLKRWLSELKTNKIPGLKERESFVGGTVRIMTDATDFAFSAYGDKIAEILHMYEDSPVKEDEKQTPKKTTHRKRK